MTTPSAQFKINKTASNTMKNKKNDPIKNSKIIFLLLAGIFSSSKALVASSSSTKNDLESKREQLEQEIERLKNEKSVLDTEEEVPYKTLVFKKKEMEDKRSFLSWNYSFSLKCYKQFDIPYSSFKVSQSKGDYQLVNDRSVKETGNLNLEYMIKGEKKPKITIQVKALKKHKEKARIRDLNDSIMEKTGEKQKIEEALFFKKNPFGETAKAQKKHLSSKREEHLKRLRAEEEKEIKKEQANITTLQEERGNYSVDTPSTFHQEERLTRDTTSIMFISVAAVVVMGFMFFMKSRVG